MRSDKNHSIRGTNSTSDRTGCEHVCKTPKSHASKLKHRPVAKQTVLGNNNTTLLHTAHAGGINHGI